MIIRAQKIERRIQQTRFLYPQVNRIGTIIGSQSARAQAFVRFARLFLFVRQTYFESPPSAALENPQNVSRLRDLPARQWIQKSKKAPGAPLLRCGLGILNQSLRSAGLAVTFAEARVLNGKSAVVVKRRAPEHRAMSHHAAGHA